jgi:hypothetical protein
MNLCVPVKCPQSGVMRRSGRPGLSGTISTVPHDYRAGPPLFESAYTGKRGHFNRTGNISTVRQPTVEKLPIWNYRKFKSTMGSRRFAAVVTNTLLFIFLMP